MRNQNRRIKSIVYFLGVLLKFFGLIMLIPIIPVLIYWGEYSEGWITLLSFLLPSVTSLLVGIAIRKRLKYETLDMTGSMLLCGVSWLVFSAFGAIPFAIGIHSSFLNGFFEAMSGFTTTGITVFDKLDVMPRSIIFWRALTQWLGGIGILSFFLAVSFQGKGAHHIFGAESHKIASGRPTPGIFRTVRILWGVYGLITLLAIILLSLEGMTIFDSVCHSFTAISTGGFSPYDTSIAHYAISGHPNFRLIEYTIAFVMLLGGINFLVHFRVLTGDVKALWAGIEMRYWWYLLFGFIGIIIIDRLAHCNASVGAEEMFRSTLFSVISIITTTGFGTQDIATDVFPALSKQLFLIMMVIGGCVGSTGGGIKVMRIVMLQRLMGRQLFKVRFAQSASNALVINNKIVPEAEVERASSLFFSWMALLVVGGCITALFTNHSAWASFSGMFSALGNIGPCYISVPDMINIPPVVKITYIIGMLAGRLEILPVLLLFSGKAWR